MRELRTPGSARGVPGNGHSYRNIICIDLVALAAKMGKGENLWL